VIVAVALETGGAASAAEWIRAANPTYPCLIDERHTLAKLYGMVNVPNAVWIDEEGRILRPAEPAGVSDVIRARDRVTGQLPEKAKALIERRRNFYYDAIRDWAEKGDASAYALSREEARNRIGRHSEDDALAAATFRMGVHLHQQGFAKDAQRYFTEVTRLRPQGWNYRRQMWNLDPESDARELFWRTVDAMGDRPYIQPIQMEGMP
jgi:hypothetical protein